MSENSTRQRLLFACMNNAWPLNNGAVIRNYWVLLGLARHFDLDMITSDALDRTQIPVPLANVLDVVEGYPRPTGRAGQLFRARGAVDPRGSFYTSDVVTRAYAKRVRDLVATRRYAAVVVDLKAWPAFVTTPVPIIYHAHNCEWKLLERRSHTETGLRKALIALDAQRVKRIERAVLARAHTTLALSEDDLNDLCDLVPSTQANSVMATNGVDVARFEATRDAATDARTLLLTGSFDWRPNQQGAQWFAQSVLPELRKLHAGIDVRLAGRMSDAFANTIRGWGATPVPNPPEMEPELARAHAIAAPILASSGTRLRILEAWAAGRPVVTTTAGAFGLPHEDGRELFARDDPGAFARAITELFTSTQTWSMVRARALERVRDFDWHAISTRLGDETAARLTR